MVLWPKIFGENCSVDLAHCCPVYNRHFLPTLAYFLRRFHEVTQGCVDAVRIQKGVSGKKNKSKKQSKTSQFVLAFRQNWPQFGLRKHPPCSLKIFPHPKSTLSSKTKRRTIFIQRCVAAERSLALHFPFDQRFQGLLGAISNLCGCKRESGRGRETLLTCCTLRTLSQHLLKNALRCSCHEIVHRAAHVCSVCELVFFKKIFIVRQNFWQVMTDIS